VRLPQGSAVWSVAVQGQPETQALASNGDEAPEVLVNIINSSEGFPVELIYTTARANMGFMDRVTGELPVPDMVVTESRWDLYLPDDLGRGAPVTDMDVLTAGQCVGEEDIREATRTSGESHGLRISVPAAGVLYSFPKLYANQSDRGTSLSISYRSGRSEQLSGSLGLAGAFLLWLGLAALARRRRTQGAFAIALGATALLTTRFYFGSDSSGAIQLFVFLSAAALAWLAWKRIGGVVRNRIDAFMADDPEPPSEDATAAPTDDDEDEAFDGAIDEAPEGAVDDQPDDWE
jgi:hypothetical protein